METTNGRLDNNNMEVVSVSHSSTGFSGYVGAGPSLNGGLPSSPTDEASPSEAAVAVAAAAAAVLVTSTSPENLAARCKREEDPTSLEDSPSDLLPAAPEGPTPETPTRMSTEISAESEDAWRNYCYDHPLHAATTAMLNLGGVSALHEEQGVSIGGILYDHYYKNPSASAAAAAVVVAASSTSSSSSADKTDPTKTVHELWPATGGTNSTATGPSKGPGGPSSVSDLVHNSSIASHSSGLDVYQHSVKKEPEDLTRRSHSHTERIMTSEKVHSSVISRALANGELVNGTVSSLDSLGHTTISLVETGDDSPSSPVVHIRRPLSNEGVSAGDSSSTALLASTSSVVDLARAGLQPSLQHYQSPSQAFSPTTLTTIQSVHGYDSPGAYGVLSPTTQTRYTTINHAAIRQTNSIYSVATSVNNPVTNDPYYRDYFSTGDQYARPTAQLSYASGDTHDTSFVDRCIRQGSVYKQQGTGLTVDLPSPDSGIGTDAVTPRDQSVVQQNFDYTELCNAALLPDQPLDNAGPNASANSDGSRTQTTTPTSGGGHSNANASPTHTPSSRSRPWHDCGRQNEADKVQIPKVFSQYGFRYYLESPISTSQRREDDRITYINKGQFYGITLEYIPDPERPIKSQTVKSIVMLVFREEKSPDDEAKAWQFWHGRQHSVKQRILDADTKNSVGLVGCIEEVSHNAICVYWNPLESSAKINVAVQCLSTDFSSQKGVKGLPLHLQIDTYDDPRDSVPVFHRGYCQIKVFCDKGAERKTRDEERRAAKRKMAATGRNKRLDELYHPPCERSEFYSMADLMKPPALFTPAEDSDKLTPMDLQGFYGQDHERKEILESAGSLAAAAIYSAPSLKRRRLTPPPCERVMIYVRQENEEVYTPLHLVPPTSLGLLSAIEGKYKLSAASVHSLYKKNRKGIMAKIDDDMLKHYCNEDIFILEITTSAEDGMYDVTLVELFDTT